MMNRFFVALMSTALTASIANANTDYCVGIRGNGENVAAHWAGLAKLVENAGMPKTVAGGSSATVSMFFLESVAQNSIINEMKGRNASLRQRRAQGLLLKSMPAYIVDMLASEKVVSAYDFMEKLAGSDSKVTEGFWAAVAAASNYAAIEKAFNRFMPLVNPDLLEGIGFEMTKPIASSKKSNFYKNQLLGAIGVFSKPFDATADSLFVRPGIVDFRYFSVWLGTIADFYAGNVNQSVRGGLQTFIETCSTEKHHNMAWSDEAFATCRGMFQDLVKSYVEQPMSQFAHKRVFEQVGATLKSFPTTSIIKGDAVTRYEALMREFKKGNDTADFSNFKIDFSNELAFGYWGPSSGELSKLQQGLKRFRGDQKSTKFMSLGTANWFEVLSTSPAEPGLANFQRLYSGATKEKVLDQIVNWRKYPAGKRWANLPHRAEYLSAGGWSDLHPTIVLKAHGCNQVVYLTRQNGDSVFGQQVFIRLTGLVEKIPFWMAINPEKADLAQGIEGSNRLGWQVTGSSAENTAWDLGSNLGNVRSSFNNSIRAADAVYCTNWDAFNMFKREQAEMVDEAYKAPVFLRTRTASRSLQVNAAPMEFDKKKDFPGCLTPEERN